VRLGRLFLRMRKGMGEFLDIPSEDDLSLPQGIRDTVRETATEIAMSHHEKWDDSGYSNGLVDDYLPVSGQVVAIADVFDSLRATRPYKRSFSLDKTLEMMGQGMGTHFSPKALDNVVDEFESIRRTYSDESGGL
jgi:putative two-component system response regulator